MRVMQITEGLVGAQKTVMLAIHSYLKSNHHESMILYAVGDNGGDSAIRCFESKPANIVRRGMWKYLGHSDRYAYAQTMQIIRQIRSFRPEVVHIHVIHHGFVCFRMLMDFLNESQIPVVYTMHDLWAITGGCYHYTAMNCTGYQSECVSCQAKAPQLDCSPVKTHAAFLEKRKCFSQSKGMVFTAVSQWVAEECRKAFSGQYPVYPIYNGMVWLSEEQIQAYSDHEIVRRLRNEKHGRTIIIGSATSWTAQKGIDQFLELARLLGEAYWIVLVGNVSKEIMQQSPENMTYLGYISDRALMAQIYRCSDLHVSMSLEETFGMTFIEAGFQAVRSIGFRSTAIPEILEQVHGIVVDDGTAQSMAHTISHLEKENNKLSADEVKGIMDTFSQEKMVQSYYSIYELAAENP